MELAESWWKRRIQLSTAAARSPLEGETGDQETAAMAEEEESSRTWRKIGPIRVSSGERGEGKWEITRREEAA
jgi:hypothetical protein